ncbi:hypothetical protein LX32DRAFT_28100 [Colletotrichum zoysiae]|uniref:Uncharacterized protein n=1 Tax=Colletotrichum zoysiae TaxID=1216348 RepID=A0AAD9HEA8_9PEZI|nr:hypothetical protein LX32DRAFT_28100 [Colletotrichum zoysiae]
MCTDVWNVWSWVFWILQRGLPPWYVFVHAYGHCVLRMVHEPRQSRIESVSTSSSSSIWFPSLLRTSRKHLLHHHTQKLVGRPSLPPCSPRLHVSTTQFPSCPLPSPPSPVAFVVMVGGCAREDLLQCASFETRGQGLRLSLSLCTPSSLGHPSPVSSGRSTTSHAPCPELVTAYAKVEID